MKQTAVEWFIINLIQVCGAPPEGTWKEVENLLQQAKQMEKEQIIKHSLELAKILISNPYETSGKMPTELIDSYIKKNL